MQVRTRRRQGLTTRRGRPLIGIPTLEGADEVVRYFTSEEEADAVLSRDRAGVQRGLSLAGAWAELDRDGAPDAVNLHLM
ncbi:MAG: hypothetical protein U0821_04390 [Chloroflexota bacterium]